MENVKLFGIPVNIMDSEEALEKVKKFVNHSEKPVQIITLNSLMIFRSFFDKEFKEVLKNSDLNLIDSVGIAFALRLIGVRLKERIPGVDFARKIMNWLEKENKSLYLLGGTFEVISAVEKNIKNSFRNIKIVGRYHGYFKKEQNETIVTAIKKSSPDVLFVAMGSPKQEKWIFYNKEKYNAKVSIGLGGSFDIYAGKKKRAPLAIRKIGLEWLYRIITNPIRLYQIIPLILFFIASVGNGITYFVKNFIIKSKN